MQQLENQPEEVLENIEEQNIQEKPKRSFSSLIFSKKFLYFEIGIIVLILIGVGGFFVKDYFGLWGSAIPKDVQRSTTYESIEMRLGDSVYVEDAKLLISYYEFIPAEKVPENVMPQIYPTSKYNLKVNNEVHNSGKDSGRMYFDKYKVVISRANSFENIKVLVIGEENNETCKNLPSKERNKCFQELMIKTNDYNYCTKIMNSSGYGNYDSCFYDFYKHHLDEDKLDLDYAKDVCKNIDDELKRVDCYGELFQKLAVKNKDVSVCDENKRVTSQDTGERDHNRREKREWCILEVLKDVGYSDVSYCEEITSDRPKEICYSRYLENTGDDTVCDDLTDEEALYKWNDCAAKRVQLLDDQSLCSKYRNPLENSECGLIFDDDYCLIWDKSDTYSRQQCYLSRIKKECSYQFCYDIVGDHQEESMRVWCFAHALDSDCVEITEDVCDEFDDNYNKGRREKCLERIK